MKIGPTCPRCGGLAGISRLFWGLGKPFECSSCGAELIVPRGTGAALALVGFIAFWRGQKILEGLQLFALVGVIFLAIMLISFLTMKPKLVSPESDR